MGASLRTAKELQDEIVQNKCLMMRILQDLYEQIFGIRGESGGMSIPGLGRTLTKEQMDMVISQTKEAKR